MDVMTTQQRYKAMVQNRGRTVPERALASGLWRRGLRYYTHAGYKSKTGERLPGDPDLVFSRNKIVVFVDGCFWHGCSQCRKHVGLKGDFWVKKIRGNKERDRLVTESLKDLGWRVIRIPEHDVRTKVVLAKTIDYLVPLLRGASPGRIAFSIGDSSV
jgi:DNA mismatch endonuclease (patch repair protein)